MSHSQDKQDIILDNVVFNGIMNGFYVDIGAHDGVTFNNTLYFQEKYNWKGINIEANYDYFIKLKNNRNNDININCAIANYNGTGEFIKVEGSSNMISGLKDTYDSRHYERLNKETNNYNTITVNVYKLQTILDMFDIRKINYLSIDVEGGEFEVIKSINFDKVSIDIIVFENNYYDKSIEIVNYLNERNFIIFYFDLDIYMVNKNSQFINNIKY